MYDWVFDEQLTTCQSGALADLWVIGLHVADSNIADKLIQYVSGEVEAAKCVERKSDLSLSRGDDRGILSLSRPDLWGL